MFEEIKEAVAKLNEEAPRPNLAPLILSDHYDLTTDWPDKSWYGATKPGMYIFVSDEGQTLYIGKASRGQARVTPAADPQRR